MRTDSELARVCADDAGVALRRLRANGSPSGAEGDALAQQVIVGRLHRERPFDAILSEEAADDPARLSAERVWIVDPLDGTREFAEPGRSDWAVHVALWCAGRLVAGAVALPATGVTVATDTPLQVPEVPARRMRIAVSRTRAPSFLAEVAEALDARLVPLGSAGYKTAAVISGELDAYVHAGGQYEWDSAAPVAVATAAGLYASRLDGSPLTYNMPNPLLPDLVVCRPELAPSLMAAIGSTLLAIGGSR